MAAERLSVDEQLERDITDQSRILAHCRTKLEQDSAWIVLKNLIARRSPERVAQMERERALS